MGSSSDKLQQCNTEISKKDYPGYFSPNDFLRMIKQGENVCKIILNKDKKGTGFLCKIPFPDFYNLLPVLISNNHVLKEEHILIGKTINFSLKDDTKMISIHIDKTRKKYTNEDYDITIIEIKKSDNLNIDLFLEVDNSINTDNPKKVYNDQSVYIIHYPFSKTIQYSPGKINIFENNIDIKYFCATEEGSSGGPILISESHKVIGVHKGSSKRFDYNIGIFIKAPITDFYNKQSNNCFNDKIILDNNKFMIFDNLTLIKKLGSGHFGEVFLASSQRFKEKFAIKKINIHSESTKLKKYLDRGIKILKEIDHPNILKLYDIKESKEDLYLVREYCNGENLDYCLNQYIEKYKAAFPEQVVQYLMKQIVSAINYLHKQNIIHRYISLEHILVNFDSEEDIKMKNMLKAKIKIYNFSFACQLNPGELAHESLGSVLYMDPSLLIKTKDNYGYDQKVDIWSLGAICYELLVGNSPFDSEDCYSLINKIQSGNYYLPIYLSKESISFINSMLQYDFKKRLNAEKLINHEFLIKPCSEFTQINPKKAQKYIVNSKIKMNTKDNSSILDIF